MPKGLLTDSHIDSSRKLSKKMSILEFTLVKKPSKVTCFFCKFSKNMRTFGLPNVKQLNMVGRPDVFLKKVKVFLEISLRNFAKFTGKHLCQSLFFNKVAGQISKNTFLQRTPLMASSVLLSRLNIPALFLFFQGDRVNVVGLYGI